MSETFASKNQQQSNIQLDKKHKQLKQKSQDRQKTIKSFNDFKLKIDNAKQISETQQNMKYIVKTTYQYLRKNEFAFFFVSNQLKQLANLYPLLIKYLPFFMKQNLLLDQLFFIFITIKDYLYSYELPQIKQKQKWQRILVELQTHFNQLQKYWDIKQFNKKQAPQIDQSALLFIQCSNGVKEINTLQSYQKLYQKKSKKNQLCQKLNKLYPKSIFEQSTINRLKKMLQDAIVEINKSLNTCCAVYFQFGASVSGQQSSENQFKDYRWPIELSNLVHHVRKTIVGYLNTEGGIIYVGIKQQKDKSRSVSGISLDHQQKYKFFEWLHTTICLKIYPEFSKSQLKIAQANFKQSLNKLKSEQNTQKFQKQYFINKYISVQFIAVSQKKTFYNAYDQNHKKKYVVKIKIRPGTKIDTYHLLSESIQKDKSGQIQCYKRTDDIVKKLSFTQFMKFFQDRSNQFLNPVEGQKKKTCENCAFDKRVLILNNCGFYM